MSLKNKIQALKEARNAVILAHYYVPDEVQEIADYVGDSYYLSKLARDAEADTIDHLIETLSCATQKTLLHIPESKRLPKPLSL